MKEIYKKLFEVRKKVATIEKTADNPFFKSTYATYENVLDALNPVLEEQGLLLLQPGAKSETGTVRVVTRIIDIESGEEVSGVTQLDTVKKDPQASGSAITYAKRYGLLQLLAIKTEDDDGNSATHDEKSSMYVITEIKKLTKELELEEKLTSMLEGWNIAKVEDLSKDRGQAVLNRLREVKKERNQNA